MRLAAVPSCRPGCCCPDFAKPRASASLCSPVRFLSANCTKTHVHRAESGLPIYLTLQNDASTLDECLATLLTITSAAAVTMHVTNAHFQGKTSLIFLLLPGCTCTTLFNITTTARVPTATGWPGEVHARANDSTWIRMGLQSTFWARHAASCSCRCASSDR